jgi:hypothetical protein
MPDLEDYWEEIRVRSPIRVITTKGSDLDSQLMIACEKALFDIKAKFQERAGEKITHELLSEMVTEGIRALMTNWREGLRGQNLAGLIEIVLEGQDLPPAEMLAFVQALPGTLLQRICESAVGTATGIHGLIAVEWHRRQGLVSHMNVEPEGSRVKVAFTDPAGRISHFFLDDPFDLEAQ